MPAEAGADPAAGATAARLTIVVPLYNASGTVAEIVSRVVAQRHPDLAPQSDWLAAIFVDDASRDDTVAVLRRCLAALGDPPHYEVLQNHRNLGLAASLNRALERVATPFVLTCHCDCLFGDDRFAARALALAEEHPHAGAIAGQARLPAGRRLPFAELLNNVTNLMDVVGEDGDAALVPIGFAEGRCDLFRCDGLRQVGFYDPRLRTAGEDQLLSARLRAAGYGVYKAPGLVYELGASTEQDSIGKLLRHQRLFGRLHPYILLRGGDTLAGIAGVQAGGNRRGRALLRLTQLLAVPLYVLAAAAVLLPSLWPAALALAVVLALRTVVLLPVLRAVRPGGAALLAIAALQPALDGAYALGVAEGVVLLLRQDPSAPRR